MHLFIHIKEETNQLEPTIAHIIQSCLKKDKQAQQALYEKYKVQWYMLCRRYASNEEEVKDMFQNGLLEIFSDLHQFDASKANFSTWSNRILAHAALKRLKALKRLDSFERALLEEEDFEGIDIEDEKIDQETITQAIQKLPVGYRTVFNLYVLEGYTHAEIASYLDISVNTSKSQLLKAKKQLRRWLEVKL